MGQEGGRSGRNQGLDFDGEVDGAIRSGGVGEGGCHGYQKHTERGGAEPERPAWGHCGALSLAMAPLRAGVELAAAFVRAPPSPGWDCDPPSMYVRPREPVVGRTPICSVCVFSSELVDEPSESTVFTKQGWYRGPFPEKYFSPPSVLVVEQP